jgi:hypothetical protein
MEGTEINHSKAPASQMEICHDVWYHSGNSEPEKDVDGIFLIGRRDNLIPKIYSDDIHWLSNVGSWFLRYATAHISLCVSLVVWGY